MYTANIRDDEAYRSQEEIGISMAESIITYFHFDNKNEQRCKFIIQFNLRQSLLINSPILITYSLKKKELILRLRSVLFGVKREYVSISGESISKV